MTNDKNFKRGDRVRVKCTDIEDVIIDVLDNNVILKNNGYWSVNVIELVEPTDRRTAFLTRLQSLLREFDAKLGDSGITRIEGMEITFGDNTPCIRYKHCTLNADNIMDFEKE